MSDPNKKAFEPATNRALTRRRPSKPKRVTGHQMRLNQFELTERRQDVMRLRLTGLTYSAIATKLSLTPNMVRNDLRAVALENQTKFEKATQTEVIADALSSLSEVERRAWEEFESGTPGTIPRLKALDLIRTITSDKLKALTDCGLIQKEPNKVEVEHIVKLDWNDEVRVKVVMALLNQAMPAQLMEPTPETHNVIDVEPVTIESMDLSTLPDEADEE